MPSYTIYTYLSEVINHARGSFFFFKLIIIYSHLDYRYGEGPHPLSGNPTGPGTPPLSIKKLHKEITELGGAAGTRTLIMLGSTSKTAKRNGVDRTTPLLGGAQEDISRSQGIP